VTSAYPIPDVAWPRGLTGTTTRGNGLSRRQLLRVGVECAATGILLWSGGCARVRQTAAVPVTLSFQPHNALTLVPGLLSRYTKVDPSVHFVPGQGPFGLTAAPGSDGYVMWSTWSGMEGNGLPNGMVPLTTVLRSANFSVRQLLAGALDTFTLGGDVYGLPYMVTPWAVGWRTDAFAAAGIAVPAATWTLDDFEAACAALQGAIAGGRIPWAKWVLPVAAGRVTQGAVSVFGFLADVRLAAALAAGYGAPLYGNGRFQLTTAAALAALDRLVQICRNYAAPTSTLFIPKSGQPYPPATSVLTLGRPLLPKGGASIADPATASLQPLRRYARFPLMPVRPVVPVDYQGIAVGRTGQEQAKVAETTDQHVVAAVRFALWLYQPDQQRALEGAGLPPVVADAATQDAFWTAQLAGFSAVGDWRNFADVLAGWPPVRVQAIGDALMLEVQEPGSLAQRLAQAEKQLNQAVGQLPPGA